jgi:S-adenosylmethionine synthetase
MSYLFTSESVSEGHPDKVADAISDAILDEIIKHDPEAKVACETFVTTGLVVIGGEVKMRHDIKAHLDYMQVARDTINRIGYNKSEYQFDGNSCGVLVTLHDQSPDINQGVERAKEEEQGAGDQGMMFGYASNETDNYMPLSLELSHLLLRELAVIRRENKQMKYLRPDAKAQVTIEYSDTNKPIRIDTIVVSTQHDEFVTGEDKMAAEKKMQDTIKADILRVLIPRIKKQLPSRVRKLFNDQITYHVNPTGKFVIGGPHGDTGLTGRKIIVDTYGGRGAHGGGAFSGKDPSKVDRSAAYAARHIAKNLVAAGVADQVLVQVAYAIGIAEPVSINLSTYRTGKVKNHEGKRLTDEEISEKIKNVFDMRPAALIKRLGLKNPIYSDTSAYGHMGRVPDKKTIHVNGKTREVETFTWERLDYVDKIKGIFGLN